MDNEPDEHALKTFCAVLLAIVCAVVGLASANDFMNSVTAWDGDKSLALRSLAYARTRPGEVGERDVLARETNLLALYDHKRLPLTALEKVQMAQWEHDLAAHAANHTTARTVVNGPVSAPKTRPATFSAGTLGRSGNYGPSAVDLNRTNGN